MCWCLQHGSQGCGSVPEFSHLRNLPFHKVTSAPASMIRQSGNILDIAQAICTRSNRVLGFVHQYRVHLLMMGSCRTANSCKAGLIVGAPRVACNGLCTAARLHSADENPCCLLGCGQGLDCLRHHYQCPTLFRCLLAI